MTTKTAKRIAILGSTGSIGCQALEVIRNHHNLFTVEILTAQNNAQLLIQQAIEFVPNAIVIGNEKYYQKVRDALADYPIKVFAGENALREIVSFDSIDLVLTAMVGIAGLEPTINAIKSEKTIALANKETLVVAGNIITNLARNHHVNILPVDSEHSAIFQCLAGEMSNPIEKIYLTASGGPFRGKNSGYLSTVKKEVALNHPNWNMGCKISIDSATLMNKGLEVIEASWLFGLNASEIDVVIHPQSIIHSVVQFQDGSMKAQMGLPDMKIPIQYALTYPVRIPSNAKRFCFWDFPELSFEKPDTENFPCLGLAYEALEKGGNMPCVLNAANEIAVASYLKDAIGFTEIPALVSNCMNKISFIANPTIEDIIETDKETRLYIKSFI
jgi:1-deoxy-D-xylulose-5-phosphate reductoisomerase